MKNQLVSALLLFGFLGTPLWGADTGEGTSGCTERKKNGVVCEC